MIRTILAAIAAFMVSVTASAVEPASMTSMQPYQEFAPGTGYGVAKKYLDRSKEQVGALLRNSTQWSSEMRISCETWVAQVVEAHPGIPFEGCTGAASAIEGSDFTVIPCGDTDNHLSVTNMDGSAHGSWHRACQSGEKMLAWKGTVIASLRCMNVAIPVTPAPQPVATPVASPAVDPRPPRREVEMHCPTLSAGLSAGQQNLQL